jgi:hypothetical protein
VDRSNHFRVVDPLQVDRRHPAVGVAQLTLDDSERHSLSGHLDCVGVVKLMRRKAAPDAGIEGEASELRSRRRSRPPRGDQASLRADP